MKNPLSSNEFKIMQLLWEQNRPLSRPEIIALTPDKDWNPNSIHLILNNMLEKGVIEITGMTRCGRGYGRTYAAKLTNLQYAAEQLITATPDLTPEQRATGILQELLNRGDLSAETRQTLAGLLQA